MRLIDADALLENAYESDMWDRGTQKFNLRVVDADDIENAPTIEPNVQTAYLKGVLNGAYAERERTEPKTGEWIQKDIWSEGVEMGESWGYYYECSECHGQCKIDYKFCPHCGTRMNRKPMNDPFGVKKDFPELFRSE